MPAGGVGCSPLPCLRRLFTRDDDSTVVVTMAMMMTMVMVDEPHCPWVIYNDLYGAVQCSYIAEGVGRLCTVLGVASQSSR